MINFILGNFLYILSLLLSIILIFFRRKEKIYWILIFLIYFLLALFYIIYLEYVQYIVWASHPISRNLLPPNQSIFYFISYTYHHIYKDFVWRLLGAFWVFLLIYFLNKMFKETLFYEEEYYIIPILTSFIDFPLNFFLIIFGFAIIFFLHILNKLKRKSDFFEKISLKDNWVFIAIFLIIINMIAKNKLGILELFKP